jgi:hypothetical protein
VNVTAVSSGGSFAVSGTMPAKGTGSNIIGSLDYGATGATALNTDNNCSVTMANNAPVPPRRGSIRARDPRSRRVGSGPPSRATA